MGNWRFLFLKDDGRGLGISRGGGIMVGSARILFDLLEGKEIWGGEGKGLFIFN